MKHIQKFEKFSEERIDDILDKMNKGKILTREEEFILNNPSGKKKDLKKSIDYKDTLIEDIKSKVEKYGSVITISDMEADSSPLYKEKDQEIHLIETLSTEDVTVVVYGGYKYESEMDQYDVKYEKLIIETLEEINDLLDSAIENELLEEDI